MNSFLRKTYNRQFKNFEIGLGNFGKIKVDLKGVREALGASADLMDSVVQANFIKKIEGHIYKGAAQSFEKQKQFGRGGRKWAGWSDAYDIWRDDIQNGIHKGKLALGQRRIGVQTGLLRNIVNNLPSQPRRIYQRVQVGGSTEKGAGVRLTLRNVSEQNSIMSRPTAYPLFFHIKRPFTPTATSLQLFMIREAKKRVFQFPIIARHFGFR